MYGLLFGLTFPNFISALRDSSATLLQRERRDEPAAHTQHCMGNNKQLAEEGTEWECPGWGGGGAELG